MEIDLIGHEGGNAEDEHCYPLIVTDIATEWEKQSHLAPVMHDETDG